MFLENMRFVSKNFVVENELHCLGKSRFALDIIDRDSKFLLTNRMFSKNITPCFIHLYQNLF
jgi:hypothetical protein